MALEAGDGFISGLVATNPVNATDQVAQGDDHIRLVKTAVKGTFPNLNGAVTCTPAELNILDGATLSTAELNILDGVTLTASQINDAARKSVVNTFTENQQINRASAAFALNDGSIEARWRSNGSLIQFGNASNHTLQVITFDTTRLEISGAGNFDFKAGTVTTTGSSSSEVGYNGTPQNEQNGNYTLVLADRGKVIYKASGGAGETITIPANASVAFPVGTIVRIVNNGGGDLTIAITSDTLSLAGAGTTGSRTLSDHGAAVIEKVASTEWFISGVGLS
jgi:hypothetical protein